MAREHPTIPVISLKAGIWLHSLIEMPPTTIF
jgi:hypothetical protein